MRMRFSVHTANERQIFRYVMLPGAAAWVINGLKMSLPYAGSR
jgi:ABC-type nitrate/sulfonate/bicarbonate transport system permease component